MLIYHYQRNKKIMTSNLCFLYRVSRRARIARTCPWANRSARWRSSSSSSRRRLPGCRPSTSSSWRKKGENNLKSIARKSYRVVILGKKKIDTKNARITKNIWYGSFIFGHTPIYWLWRLIISPLPLNCIQLNCLFYLHILHFYMLYTFPR